MEMLTLTEIKKELKKFKSFTVKTILLDEYEGEYSLDVCATVMDVYGNFDSEFITVGEFDSMKKAEKHGKMLATKFACKFEISNC
jgi:hypothetical protein